MPADNEREVELEEFVAFTAQALRTLQSQIDAITNYLGRIEEKIHTTETTSERVTRIEFALKGFSNDLQYLFPPPSDDEIIIRTAAGQIVSRSPEILNEEENGTN